jgi:hypothetical protein
MDIEKTIAGALRVTLPPKLVQSAGETRHESLDADSVESTIQGNA